MEAWLQETLENYKDNPFPNQVLALTNRRISQIDWIPDNVYQINLGFNQLQEIPLLNRYIKVLVLEYNQLHSLPFLPDKLLSLNVNMNRQLQRLPELPQGLESLKATHCCLRELPSLPSSLEYLNVSYNQLEILPRLPDRLYSLLLAGNCLEDLPLLPESLKKLDIRMNPRLEAKYGGKTIDEIRALQRLERAKPRMEVYKEDLMAAAWHPKRVWKLLDAGIDTEDM
jgi:Leucine-rich repeat (LRR) protein